MDDNCDYDFDDSPAGDVRRWLDVVSHQLERLEERLRDSHHPRVLTADGETIVWQLVDARERLRRGEIIDEDYVRRLLDMVMNFSTHVLASARSQERAENVTYIGAAAETAPK